jgi:hypothetical protein
MVTPSAPQSDAPPQAEAGVRVWDGIRVLLAIVYLLGGVVHLLLAIVSPTVYEGFAEQALVGAYTTMWETYVVPQLGVLVPMMGVIELAIGGALLVGGRATTLAHGAGAVVQSGLVLSGPWGPVNGLLAVVHVLGSRRSASSLLDRMRHWRSR